MYDPQKLKTKCKGIAKENKFGVNENSRQIILIRNYSEPYCPKIMSGVPSKAAFNALTAFMSFFLAVPM